MKAIQVQDHTHEIYFFGYRIQIVCISERPHKRLNTMSDRLFYTDREVSAIPNNFIGAFGSYVQQIRDAINNNKHHDHRRNLLINFLREGMGLDPVEFELEHKVQVHKVRGRIDALFRHLIIEVKTDIERERRTAKEELKKYFESRKDPKEYFGLVTDGLNFKVYLYEAPSVRKIREFSFDPGSPTAAFRDLDQLFFTVKSLAPYPSDMVERFGTTSATYNVIYSSLLPAFEAVEKDTSVSLKFQEWNFLLSKVYGSEIGDNSLFITHTYLVMLSRTIVALTFFPEKKRNSKMLRGIVNGAFFQQNRLGNLAEPDFFSWALGTKIEKTLLKELETLFLCLSIYDFTKLDGDVLKELYQGLVDPKSRHDLGEYYTPDWLAELILEKINYVGGKLLDPACGSGSFLYAAAKRLRKRGEMKGSNLVRNVIENIIGIDVHPVAVLMAKANLLLSLHEEILKYPGDISLRVYMADTLITGEDKQKKTLAIPVSNEKKAFHIPIITIEKGPDILDTLIDSLCSFVKRGAKSKEKEKGALSGWKKTLERENCDIFEKSCWIQNFNLLLKLEKNEKNTLWAYILKNSYRPSYLRQDKVDYLVGNPPWLAYGFIKNEAYKKRVKELTFEHHLLKKKERNLFTSIDTSTLFFAHCQRDFLKVEGIIAFVMPKSSMIPAKQHIAFQRMGFSEIADLARVTSLFNVPSCILIRNAKHKISNIPCTEYYGNFKNKGNIPLVEAEKILKSEQTKHTFPIEATQYSPYYEKFIQGATLMPRCFWFVEPIDSAITNSDKPFLRTSKVARANSKNPWKMEVEGTIEKDFLFGTVLAKDLLPFVIHYLSLVVLPVSLSTNDKLTMINQEQALADGFIHAHDWFVKAEEIWTQNQKSDMETISRLNYNSLLTNQTFRYSWIVLYNKSGSNISAAVLERSSTKRIGAFKIRGFIADSVTYWFATDSEDEAYYLAGVLNSPLINTTIKPFQTQGLMGARDIHRRPFEVCNIPLFDPKDIIHKQIAELAKECRVRLLPLVPARNAAVGKVRAEVRKLVSDILRKIDENVSSLLKIIPIEPKGIRNSSENQKNLFE